MDWRLPLKTIRDFLAGKPTEVAGTANVAPGFIDR